MRSKRVKRITTPRRRGIYLLPNLFTSASLFGGFYSIIATVQGRYEAAAVAIVISALFDGLDGRIARLTHTTSDFGVEYDSLADLVAFGVAPGILSFKWALEPFGRLGWLAAFMYVICGALRLARFNVQKNTAKPNYFRGLPIPAAACLIALCILFVGEVGGILESKPVFILSLIYVLSFLMVSTIHYFSFKKFEIRDRKPFNVLVSVILICMVIAYQPTLMLFLIMLSYIFSGPVYTVYRFYSRRFASRKSGAEGIEKIEGGDIPGGGAWEEIRPTEKL